MIFQWHFMMFRTILILASLGWYRGHITGNPWFYHPNLSVSCGFSLQSIGGHWFWSLMWLIPLGNRVGTLVVKGISRVNPLINGVLRCFNSLTGMKHQLWSGQVASSGGQHVQGVGTPQGLKDGMRWVTWALNGRFLMGIDELYHGGFLMVI